MTSLDLLLREVRDKVTSIDVVPLVSRRPAPAFLSFFFLSMKRGGKKKKIPGTGVMFPHIFQTSVLCRKLKTLTGLKWNAVLTVRRIGRTPHIFFSPARQTKMKE